MKKRISAILLAALMVASILPTFAANEVAKYDGTPYGTLQEAIDAAEAANDKDIVIDLLADATLDITAWETLAIGGDAETVTINGNGKTLTFNKKNSDWNNISTIDAKLILNDMTLADSGCNDGPWNRYDHNFECVVELNNIVSTKPLAFKNDAVLNNVKINADSDVYAIWVQPNGQDISIDGLEVNAGRGIKIDEQYVSNPGKVDLSVENATFTTTKKSAILVKSSGGADITVENIDISGVAADSVNAVWTDEDAAATNGPITVTGATQTIEGAGDGGFVAASTTGGQVKYYNKVDDAINNSDDDSIVLVANYTEESNKLANVKVELTGGVKLTSANNALNVVAPAGYIVVKGGTTGAYTYEIEVAPAPAYAGPVMNWVKVNAADNGVVKSGPLAASAGATVTLYPKAAEGYVLDTVEVLDAEGNAVVLDGLKFAIPAGGVTVNATFKLAD